MLRFGRAFFPKKKETLVAHDSQESKALSRFIVSFFYSVLIYSLIVIFSLGTPFSAHAEYEEEALMPALKGFLEAVSWYEEGLYSQANYLMQESKKDFSEFDIGNLWRVNFYIGLTYHLMGKGELGQEAFREAWVLIPEKSPDPYLYSTKVLKWFEDSKKPVEKIPEP